MMPVGFVGHGAPLAALETEGAPAAWRKWGRSIRPKAILVVSAHWLKMPTHVGAVRTLPLIYDFYGFPDELYSVAYAPPGAPDLARRVMELMGARQDMERGLDHGAWVPLLHMFPGADIPVLQISLATGVPMKEHLALGRALAPLRDEGVFILASGNVTHNLRRANLRDRAAAPDSWAVEFDAWCADALTRNDLDALADYSRAPGGKLAVPTDDHYAPLLVAAAAGGSARFPHVGIEYQNLSMRCVEFT